MLAEKLTEKFMRIGARVKLNAWQPGEVRRNTPRFTADVKSDDVGEFFDLRLENRAMDALHVVHSDVGLQHLLLQADVRATRGDRERFLCGRDETHWFVAALPDKANPTTVESAMEALKPPVVLAEQWRIKLPRAKRQLRRNDAYIRQGEWFFVPRPKLAVPEHSILHGERLSRGTGSKAHVVDQLVRFGGELVYVSSQFPSGLATRQYERWRRRNPKSQMPWTTMQRGARAYVRGSVRHADHETVHLPFWHEVAMNTEHESRAMRHVVFLD